MEKFDQSVFERSSCPEWANYAVVGKNGVVIYSSKPMRYSDGDWLMNSWDNKVLVDYNGEKIVGEDLGDNMLVKESNSEAEKI